jgi:hypothetical protein
MEAAGEVSGDVRIGLEVNRQGGQRGLRLPAAAAEQVGSHAGGGRNPRAGERELRRSIWGWERRWFGGGVCIDRSSSCFLGGTSERGRAKD